MWAAQHSSTPSRVSAKNVDLRIAQITEHTAQPNVYPVQTDMWLGKDQSSRTSSFQYSIPSLSPRSAIVEDDDSYSQASDSTAYSITHTPEHKAEMPVQILSPDKYEPHSGAVEIITALSDDPKLHLTEVQQDLGEGLKTPRVAMRPIALESFDQDMVDGDNKEELGSELPSSEATTAEDDHTSKGIEEIGPLREQLLAVISKISVLETNQPTVMAADYTEIQQRVAKLEAEKTNLLSRHEAILTIRDEDITNLVKIRGLLAHERREHESIRRLRDEDLQNVIALRNKLAEATWTPTLNQKRMERTQSIPQNNDLWQTAKTAALEQRVLELELANADMREKLDHANSQLQLQQQHQIHPAEHHPQQHGPQAVAPFVKSEPGALTNSQRGLEAFFELALRQRERYNREVEKLKLDNEDLRGRLGEREYQMEGLKVLLEGRYGLK